MGWFLGILGIISFVMVAIMTVSLGGREVSIFHEIAIGIYALGGIIGIGLGSVVMLLERANRVSIMMSRHQLQRSKADDELKKVLSSSSGQVLVDRDSV